MAEYLYENNPEICDTVQNQNITMIFTFGLNGVVPYCLSDDDCPSKCMKCNQARRVCYSTCNKDSTESKCCAGNDTCVACCSDSDCPGQQICHPVDHTCTEIPEQCAENQFRSISGACINCAHASNVIVDPNAKINADVLTQQEMCLACSGRWTEEINGNTYCSRICTSGINFRSVNGQCINCSTPGFHRIDPHDPEALQQCLSCPEHIWIRTILQG